MSTPITGDSSKTPEPAGRQIFTKPPFRLFFNETKVPGRSDISTSHPATFVNCTKDKFYSKYDSRSLPNPSTVEFVKRALEAGPRDKQPAPETESQRYGWYWDVSFTDRDILHDDRLNFHHQASPLIKLQTSVNLASKLNKALENPPK